MEVPDKTPWTCHTCGARAYDLEGWGINPNHTLYCNKCEPAHTGQQEEQ